MNYSITKLTAKTYQKVINFFKSTFPKTRRAEIIPVASIFVKKYSKDNRVQRLVSPKFPEGPSDLHILI